MIQIAFVCLLALQSAELLLMRNWGSNNNGKL